MSYDYRHRIDVLANVKKENELKESYFSFEKVNSLWAAIVPQTGNMQRQAADTILTNVTHKVVVRYSAGKDITKDMRMCFKGREFEIKFILNPYERNETLEIFCSEVVV